MLQSRRALLDSSQDELLVSTQPAELMKMKIALHSHAKNMHFYIRPVEKLPEMA